MPRSIPESSVGVGAAYMLVTGVIASLAIGQLVIREKQTRDEMMLVADTTTRLEVRLGLNRTIGTVLGALVRFFGARRAVLAVHDIENGRFSRWDAGLPATGHAEPARLTSLDVAAKSTYLFEPMTGAWDAIRRPQAFDVVYVDRHGARTSSGPPKLPDDLLDAIGPFERVIAVSVGSPREWAGRLFLLEPRPFGGRVHALATAQRIVLRLAPAVYNVYLLRRIRTRSVADERARIGRELHDGIVQTVLGVQVQLHALAVNASGIRRELAADLHRLALTLRDEVLGLRDMMQQLKPVSPAADQLIDALVAVVQRFETETGIHTRFITQADHVPLSPRACLEVTRVVQESLVNVRKHSGARNVFVRFSIDSDVCRLSVDDDGSGFPFAGRLSLAELERTHQGPAVIKERVRRLGGELVLESVPGRGSRLEISFPSSTYAVRT